MPVVGAADSGRCLGEVLSLSCAESGVDNHILSAVTSLLFPENFLVNWSHAMPCSAANDLVTGGSGWLDP